MRWATYTSSRDDTEHVAVLSGEHLHALPAGTGLLDLLRAGDEGLPAAAVRALAEPFEVLALADAALVAPVPVPPSVRDFMAFERHVVDSMAALGAIVDPVWYQQPVFYFTNPAAIIGPTDANPIAPGSTQWDYELEIAAIVGTPGRDLDPATAETHIAGYTILCDWSARDLQATEMRVNLGPAKGKDTATSLGPLLVTPDELEPFRHGTGYHLAMTAAVNGTPYSSGTWADLHWSFAQMLAYASRGTELRPGDVIGSGTVGTGCILELSRVHGHDSYPWLQPGDEVRLTVEQLGAITSTVTTGAQPIPLG
jgi:2-keto-4-pentenoate hydratase/2-oxohepta-3-ene-1,7-dioic acid hydratase in catechol pathway